MSEDNMKPLEGKEAKEHHDSSGFIYERPYTPTQLGLTNGAESEREHNQRLFTPDYSVDHFGNAFAITLVLWAALFAVWAIMYFGLLRYW